MADTSSYIEKLQAKRQTTAQTSKEQAEQRAMLAELKKIQMSSLMGSGKSTVILTDQTDLGDKIKDLTTKAVTAIEGLKTTEHNNRQQALLGELIDCINNLELAVDKQQTAIERQTVQLLAALRNIKLDPKITVPAPNVTVQPSELNLKPLEKALAALKPERMKRRVNLSDYRAHDLADAPDGKQYIGFMSADGSWYIMESDDSSNTMRYYFGTSDYDEAWSYRTGHTYKTLGDAIRGLSA